MKVRGLKIWPPLLLAPMAGLTHSALRTTLLGCGGVGLLSTEMLSAARLPVENAQLSPYLVRTPVEQPLSYQLLVADEKYVTAAMARLRQLEADSVDLNLGCPAPQVRRMGGGSCLMDDPQRVRRIVAGCRRATQGPLSAKIRLGERLDETALRDFCQMLVGEGIDLLTVHARLRGESFARRPRWEWIAKVKQWIGIPVIANGGVDSVENARLCLELSGADGLMIGRAAAVRPWIFAEIARALYGEDIPGTEIDLPLLYSGFVKALIERFAVERRLGRLKEFTHYFAKNYFFGHHLAAQVQSSQSVEEAWGRAVQFFVANGCPAGALPGSLQALMAARGGCNSQNPGGEIAS